MVNLLAKFEVCTFSHFRDIRGSQNSKVGHVTQATLPCDLILYSWIILYRWPLVTVPPRSESKLFESISRERLKVQNSNLAGRLTVRDTNPKNEKWVKRGRGPLLSLERLKVQTSNFACGLKVRDSRQGNEKWFKWGRGLGHVTYFSNFWTPWYIYGMAENTKLIFCKHVRVRDT